MPTFTQKHFETISRILKEHSSSIQSELIEAFAEEFMKDNPRFNQDKFYDSIGFEDSIDLDDVLERLSSEHKSHSQVAATVDTLVSGGLYTGVGSSTYHGDCDPNPLVAQELEDNVSKYKSIWKPEGKVRSFNRPELPIRDHGRDPGEPVD